MPADSVHADSSGPFYVFKSPTVVAPTLELTRSIANVYSKLVYRHMVEKEYSNESFLRGAMQAMALCAKYLRESRYDLLPRIVNNDACERLRRRLGEIEPEAKERLNFSKENIRHAFIHSSTIAPDRLLAKHVDNEYAFFATVVGFIDRNSTAPERSRAALLRRVPDLLVCNVTLARRLDSVAKWRITDINFFDSKFVRYC